MPPLCAVEMTTGVCLDTATPAPAECHSSSFPPSGSSAPASLGGLGGVTQSLSHWEVKSRSFGSCRNSSLVKRLHCAGLASCLPDDPGRRWLSLACACNGQDGGQGGACTEHIVALGPPGAEAVQQAATPRLPPVVALCVLFHALVVV